MLQPRQMRLAVALVICAVVAVTADGEAVAVLQGEEAALPMGWIRDPNSKADLGQGSPSTVLTTSAAYSGTADEAAFTYKMVTGGKPMSALKELAGEELMGEGIDDSEDKSRITISGLQAHLENAADMVGKVSRLTAVKVLLSMPGVQQNDQEELDEVSLLQVGAGTGWGRRRRGAEWEQNPIVQQQKAQEKAEADDKAGTPSPPGPKPPPKVVVKKEPDDQNPATSAKGENDMDEARGKADKAIEMAREKGDKATKKAEEEARAAQQEADDKKAFELAEKRKHEVTNKEEQQREKKMKDHTEKSKKKAKEAATKAEVLAKAVEKAKEASEKEQVKEKAMKTAKEAKQKEERRVMIEKAKEKAAKATKEAAEKKMAELKAKFGEESVEKKQKEKALKHKHEVKQKKVDEVSKKKTEELARKTADEAKNKDAEEKALKAQDEKKMKAALEAVKKAEEERNDKAEKEFNEKKKREEALKVAAKRRIEEEKEAKTEKRKAMETSAEMATKKADEQQKKSEAESTEKIKEEVELKKTREKKEKDAREVIQKKAEEIVRKTTREHSDKIETEKSTKAFEESQHKEKKKKGEEKVQKVLEGLKNYEEALAKAREAYDKKNKLYRDTEPIESKHKSVSGNLSKIAKELAAKIKGQEEDKNPDVCDLGNNLESLKKKGLLTGGDGECAVTCSLKPSELGIQAQCKLQDEKKPECMKVLYTRMQSLASALISEFDAYKKCTLAKAQSGLKGPAGSNSANLDTPDASNFMLGESEDARLEHSLEKNNKDSVEVGEYIYALKDLQDVHGTVKVGAAMDLLMKCNRDDHGKGTKRPKGEMGESYSPLETQNFQVAANAAEGSNDGSGQRPSDCMTNSIETTIENTVSPAVNDCQVQCSTSGIDYDSYTSECNGSGKLDCFLQASEVYYRSVAGTFLSWKRQCVKYHGDHELELALVSS